MKHAVTFELGNLAAKANLNRKAAEEMYEWATNFLHLGTCVKTHEVIRRHEPIYLFTNQAFVTKDNPDGLRAVKDGRVPPLHSHVLKPEQIPNLKIVKRIRKKHASADSSPKKDTLKKREPARQ